MQLLVEVPERSGVTALEDKLLIVLNSFKQNDLTLPGIADLIVVTLFLDYFLLSLSQSFEFLLLESFLDELASVGQTLLHHCELTLVFLVVGAGETFKTLLHIDSDLFYHILG